MLLAIAALIVAFWLVGVLLHLISGLFHLILVIAVAIVLYHLIVGGKRGSRVD
ncbi:MAG TPA: DUF5670 family protein [Mycobacteriales bacterium]|nr:DUF5670 family protein [Mycobacteriales bacterium]